MQRRAAFEQQPRGDGGKSSFCTGFFAVLHQGAHLMQHRELVKDTVIIACSDLPHTAPGLQVEGLGQMQ